MILLHSLSSFLLPLTSLFLNVHQLPFLPSLVETSTAFTTVVPQAIVEHWHDDRKEKFGPRLNETNSIIGERDIIGICNVLYNNRAKFRGIIGSCLIHGE